MREAHVVSSIEKIGREAWNGLFPDEPENYDYLCAVENSNLKDFDWFYVIVEEEGQVLAAAPAFITNYALESTLDGVARKVVVGLRRVVPRLTTLRLASLGSPCTETAQIGWSTQVQLNDRPGITSLLLTAFEQAAREASCGLTAVKDVPQCLAVEWEAALIPAGYRAVAGLPSAELSIDFDSIDAYLTRLSPAARKNMRRKLKSLGGIRIEIRHDLGHREAEVMALYEETRARAEMQFESLTRDYFINVLDRMSGRALCVFYFVGSKLLAVNLLITGDGVLLDKFFCMTEEGRRYNLYFLSWFTNLRLCLERGLTLYRSGQSGYTNKLRLRSRLIPNTLYFRHRNPLLNWGLGLFAAIASPAPELEIS